jgi:dipeptidyl aminopeptidase/acylaminoacyl peptidase
MLALRRVIAAVASIALVAGLLAVVATPRAHATYPGKNGRIAYSPLTISICIPSCGANVISSIHTVEADGTDDRAITDESKTIDAIPIWSPDGSKIAFTRFPFPFNENDSSQIFLMNADGSDQRDLSGPLPRGTKDAFPAWSPDGRRIAFVRETRGGWSIFTMDSHHGSKQQELATGSGGTALVLGWSADGSQFTYVKDQGPTSVFVMDVKTGLETIVGGEPDSTVPSWTPDSREIVYVQNGAEDGIWVMDRDGANKRRLSPGNWAVASPDNSLLAVMNGETLEIRNRDGSNPVPILHAPPQRFIWFLDWQPVH